MTLNCLKLGTLISVKSRSSVRIEFPGGLVCLRKIQEERDAESGGGKKPSFSERKKRKILLSSKKTSFSEWKERKILLSLCPLQRDIGVIFFAWPNSGFSVPKAAPNISVNGRKELTICLAGLCWWNLGAGLNLDDCTELGGLSFEVDFRRREAKVLSVRLKPCSLSIIELLSRQANMWSGTGVYQL